MVWSPAVILILPEVTWLAWSTSACTDASVSLGSVTARSTWMVMGSPTSPSVVGSALTTSLVVSSLPLVPGTSFTPDSSAVRVGSTGAVRRSPSSRASSAVSTPASTSRWAGAGRGSMKELNHRTGRVGNGSSRPTSQTWSTVRSSSTDRPRAPAVVSSVRSPASIRTGVSGSSAPARSHLLGQRHTAHPADGLARQLHVAHHVVPVHPGVHAPGRGEQGDDHEGRGDDAEDGLLGSGHGN